MNKPIDPVLPFIWPEPLVSAGFNTYVTELPFDVAVRSAVSVFGVVSAIDARAVNWMEGFLADRPETQLRLVVSIHPPVELRSRICRSYSGWWSDMAFEQHSRCFQNVHW